MDSVSFVITPDGSAEDIIDFLKYVDAHDPHLSVFHIEEIEISSTANERLRFKSDLENTDSLTANFSKELRPYKHEFELNVPANETRRFKRKIKVITKLRVFGSAAGTVVLCFFYTKKKSEGKDLDRQLALLRFTETWADMRRTYMSEYDDR